MRHQSQNVFQFTFVWISQHQKGYLAYVSITWKLVYSHYVLFVEIFSIALAYTSRLYSEVLVTQPDVLYIHFDKSSHEKTGSIIKFSHFE